jgi:uncharacterized protein
MRSNRSLIITGGWAHDFASSTPALSEHLRNAGFDVVVADGVDSSAHAMQTEDFDLIVVYACWFQMKDARYSDEIRSTWSRSTSPEWRTALQRQRNTGAGLLALHTAVICFDDSPEWAEWVGGSWVWGESTHPAPGEVRLVARTEHPIVSGIEEFVVHDERYVRLGRQSHTTVLVESLGGGEVHPNAWAYERGSSRVVYSALGHDLRSLSDNTHRLIIQRSARWASGGSDAEIRAMN